MATNIDNLDLDAPLPIEEDALDESPIEIEIIDAMPASGIQEVDPETGEVTVPGTVEDDAPLEVAHGENLVQYVPKAALVSIVSDLTHEIGMDRNARKEWEGMYKKGLELLGLQDETRTTPFPGAADVVHPMVLEAMVRFQSETITETFPAAGPVKPKYIGRETRKTREAGERVTADMNYLLTEKMVEFRPEHERMLFNLPGTGAAFKKVCYDETLNRPVSLFVPAEEILLPYGVADLRSSHRVTHEMRRTPNDIRKLQVAGFYDDAVPLLEPLLEHDDLRQAKDEKTGFTELNGEYLTLYEVCTELDLPGFEDRDENGEPTGVALPYVITFIKDTNTVLGLRRNWREDDPQRVARQHFVQYSYVPGLGPYGLGLFHLIGRYAKAATGALRQLIDSGTLANLPGGLKTKGLRIKGDDAPIRPGEFRDVDVGSGTLKENIIPLPYKEPSPTLLSLLQMIVDDGRRVANTADMKVSDMSAQAPVGTVLALLERQMTVLTAVQTRVHHSLSQELKLIKQLVADNIDGDPAYDYDPETGHPPARREDYQLVDPVPVSDPNASTLSQRVVKFQAAIQMSQMASQIYDLPYLHRGMLDVLGIKNADKIIPLPDDMQPRDPVTENMSVLKGKPVKAFLHQDHEAHIRVHMAAMQDPIVMKLIGQNPKAQQLMAAAQAHIAEHVAYAYRQKIEQQLGMALPPEEAPMPPEVEMGLSQMMAQAANQVLQQSQQRAAIEQAAQKAKDPVLQLQERELQIKDKQAIATAAEKADRLALDREQMERDFLLDLTKLLVDLEKTGTQLSSQQIIEGMRAGVGVAKDKRAQDAQAAQAAKPPAPPKELL